MDLLGRITVFTLPDCRQCNAAKGKLTAYGLSYTEVNVQEHPSQKRIIEEKTGRSSLPQIFFNAKHIGGNQDLQSMSDSDMQRLILSVKHIRADNDAPQVPDDSEAESSSYFTCDCEDRPKPNQTLDEDSELESESKVVSGVEVSSSKPDDEMSSVLQAFKAEGNVTGGKKKFLLFKSGKTFSGREIVNFVARNRSIGELDALKMCRDMMRKKMITPAKLFKGKQEFQYDETLYRLVEK